MSERKRECEYYPHEQCDADGCADCMWTGSHPRVTSDAEEAEAMRQWVARHDAACARSPIGHLIAAHPWATR